MHIAIVEYRRHHGCSSLSDFADGLSVNQVIKCKQLHQSEDLLIEIIENMLSSGAVLSEGKRTFIVTQLYLNQIIVIRLCIKYIQYNRKRDPSNICYILPDHRIIMNNYLYLKKERGFLILYYKSLSVFCKETFEANIYLNSKSKKTLRVTISNALLCI